MASWGDIAVGIQRPSYDHPSKSAIMGLLAAALGIRRTEDQKHAALAESYNFAVMLNSPGILLRDYHTIQVPSQSTIKKQKHVLTRKDELDFPPDELNTILSSRDYYCDSLCTVCLWCKSDEPEYSLELLKQKLKEPEFVLYLGRKSCPISLPLQPTITAGSDLKEAYFKTRFKDHDIIPRFFKEKNVRFFWEGEDNALEHEHVIVRRDSPLSRKRWQFEERLEKYSMIDWGNIIVH
jgi:CRISPR system Cascade subunit CasD